MYSKIVFTLPLALAMSEPALSAVPTAIDMPTVDNSLNDQKPVKQPDQWWVEIKNWTLSKVS